MFVGNVGDSDAIETALQISKNLLTTPDSDDSLYFPFPRSVSYLDKNLMGKSPFPEQQYDIDSFLDVLRKRNKRYAEFLGKRYNGSKFSRPDDKKQAVEFLGKKHLELLGSRENNNVDKRYMEFLGKRAMEFLGKRTMEFLGKRYPYRNNRSGDWIG